jgi:hypothetical protein
MIDVRKWIWIPLVTFALGMVLGVAGSKCDFTPVPPKPPVVVPEVEGPRKVLIVNETLDRTPEVAAIFTQLRAGESAKYLADKKHELLILDDDASTPDGKAVELLDKHRDAFAATGLPCVLVIHPDGRVLGAAKLPQTADGVIEFLRQHGG